MSDNPKNRLLEEFQQYLDNVDFSQFNTGQPADLQTLFSEMVGLKSEVKAESRQFKNTLDNLAEALSVLKTDNQALAAGMVLHNQQLQTQRNTVSKAILIDVVDIYDKLAIGLSVLQNHKPETGFFVKKADTRFLDSVKEGQFITLKRLEQVLQRNQVVAIDCVGKMLDPQTMNALEVGHDSKVANGVVLEELRKGFLFGQEVLRLAEVKVNKL